MSQPNGDAAGPSGPRTMIAGFADQISFALGSSLRQVGADSGAAEPWAYAIVGMTLTAGEWWLDRRTMTRDDLVAYLTQLLWGGLSGAGLDKLADLFEEPESEELPNVMPFSRRTATGTQED
jgi:hypothetical protein